MESERKGMYLEQVGTVKGTGGGLSETIPPAVHVPQGRSIYPRLGGRFLSMGRESYNLPRGILFCVGSPHRTRSHLDLSGSI